MPKNSVPPSKEVKFQIRLDAELADRAKEKAASVGGLAPVIRALLRRWLKEELVSFEDIARELPRAPQKPHRSSRKRERGADARSTRSA
jgi:hypothetical protein